MSANVNTIVDEGHTSNLVGSLFDAEAKDKGKPGSADIFANLDALRLSQMLQQSLEQARFYHTFQFASQIGTNFSGLVQNRKCTLILGFLKTRRNVRYFL
jgi:hypothetical protein